ncbi:MAG: N-acyl homoserine lactonase family protein [Lachnospiraceae bacterium]|nr:N-acyl homoserine lactonase family protein [Lachnospiraceae bacterium]
MKLYCFHVGSIDEPMSGMVIPIYAYLIEHPKGLVLVDTGESYELRDENAVMEEKDTILYKLQELGYTPEDIGYVVISHLHMDHSGYLSSFPNATFIVRRAELMYAWWPEPCKLGYDFRTYEKTHDFRYIQLDDDEEYDIFMDGTVVLIDTRGHSRGHQSVIVDLPKTGRTVLAMDAVPTREIMERGFSGRPSADGWAETRSIRKVRDLAAAGCKVLFAHDPDNTPDKEYPRYYE